MKTLLTTAILATSATFLHPSDAVAQGHRSRSGMPVRRSGQSDHGVPAGAVRAGLKGGLNASSLFYNGQGVSNKNERIGFHAGVFAQVPAGEFFAVQPELLYTTKGASADFDFVVQGRNSFNLNYAELPVLLTFKLGNTVELQAGPYAAYLISTNVNTKISGGTRSLDINRNNFNKVDYGIAGGLNIYFGKAFIGARYEQGLRRIANSGAARTLLGNAKNGVGLVSVGFSLN